MIHKYKGLVLYLSDIENPKWDEGGRIHNWKNYVEDELRKRWHTLTDGEKFLVAYFADKQASAEEWD